MKTKLIIEIESPDAKDLKIIPEEGMSEDDYTEDELIDCREEHATQLHKQLIRHLKTYVQDGQFEENLIENLEELYIEDWDEFKDYGVKVTVEEKQVSK